MHCMSFFIRVIKKHSSWRQLFIVSMAVVSSLAVTLVTDASNSVVVVHSTHAMHLIRHYLQTHPVNKNTIESMKNHVNVVLNQLQSLKLRQLTKAERIQQPKQARLPAIYPVRSSLLTPGKVQCRTIQVTLPQPIFIVGDDVTSKSWLRRYQVRLRALKAKGFVVNIVSQARMRALQQQFSSLILMPIPGNALASWLKLEHYPVLISNQFIEQ